MRSVIIPSVVLPILILALIGWHRNRKLPLFAACKESEKSPAGWKWGLMACCCLAFLFVFALISLAWLQGDDWWMLDRGGLADRFNGVFHNYLDWNARLGDALTRVTRVTFDRWEPRIFNTLAVMLAPLALFRLCKKEGESMFSGKGLVFYGFTWALVMLNSYIPMWKSIFDYSACANYMYPSVATVWLLSFYRNDSLQEDSSHAKCLGLFILGVVCGWGTESADAVLVPMLTLLMVLSLKGKTRRWTPHAWAGFWGFMIGSAILILSPALGRRTTRTLEGMQLDVSSMMPEQMQDFLQNLSWDSLALIRSEGVIYIKDFPLFDRIWYFSPFWGERFLACCWVGLSAVGVLAILLLLERSGNVLRTIGWGLLIVLAGIGMGLAYLYSCIPSTMAFYPACFCINIAVCFLFLRLNNKWIRNGVSGMLLAGALGLFIPAGIEAWQYKHYEAERWDAIHAQIAEGKQDIVLPKPYPVEPRDPVGLIGSLQLGEDPTKFPNNMAARSLNVNSIRQAE